MPEKQRAMIWTMATVALVVFCWCATLSCAAVILGDWVFVNVKMSQQDRR